MPFDEKSILEAPSLNVRERYLAAEDKRIAFVQILVVPNMACSLRCKHCAAGNQYAKRKEFDPEKTVPDGKGHSAL
jgi:MoaA/NifB/PqqE/SkfB family radical SAM enzyme